MAYAKILQIPDWAAPRRFSLEGRELICRLEVQARVEELFACSVDEVSESFQRFGSYAEWLECWGRRTWTSEDLENFADLWNLTPRADLEGYRPVELYLKALIQRGADALPDLDSSSARDGEGDTRSGDVEDFGTRHVVSPITSELLKNERLLTPAFFQFVGE